MQLERLDIQRKLYGDHKGKYVAEVTVAGGGGKITMELTPEVSLIVLRDCIDHLCRATDSAAHEMKERLLATVPPSLLAPTNP